MLKCFLEDGQTLDSSLLAFDIGSIDGDVRKFFIIGFNGYFGHLAEVESEMLLLRLFGVNAPLWRLYKGLKH